MSVYKITAVNFQTKTIHYTINNRVHSFYVFPENEFAPGIWAGAEGYTVEARDFEDLIQKYNNRVTITLPEVSNGYTYTITNNQPGTILTVTGVDTVNRTVTTSLISHLETMQEEINRLSNQIVENCLLFGTAAFQIMPTNECVVPLTSLQKEINDLQSMGYREDL